jgi:hypothetical protein
MPTDSNPLPFPALRQLPRPTVVQPCPQCHRPQVTNYLTCSGCYAALEQFWQADWQRLLAYEQIAPGTPEELLLAQLVLDEVEAHPWTCLDWAMTLLPCSACGAELGGGPSDCGQCATAFGNTLWAEGLAGQRGAVTGNEHALHVGRFILRYPHRYSTHAVTAWRYSMPRLLTGWLPSTAEAQRAMALIKAGRLAEVETELHVLDQTIRMRSAKSG